MTNLEQLFIRACKRQDPKKRLQSILRRFYVGYSEECLELILGGSKL